MSMILEIPNVLEEKVRALAAARGISIEELSQQALTAGLDIIAEGSSNAIIDMGPLRPVPFASGQQIRVSSPIFVTGAVRPLDVTVNNLPKAVDDAN